MIAVIFEVIVQPGGEGEYFARAADLRPTLETNEGFISVERFRSLADPAKILSLSFWRDEDAVRAWRMQESHRAAQAVGRAGLFDDYRLRVAQVLRDYGLTQRSEVPDGRRSGEVLR
ncbi:antibiotic biosynthesis monooxygenase family protein [Sphingomonas agri]|uniref:antibiotic biosynthesis monooxygenase family protein n=1 Tax=Sphingomonas agri TaxID=1813878 RepID=UPI00311EAA22